MKLSPATCVPARFVKVFQRRVGVARLCLTSVSLNFLLLVVLYNTVTAAAAFNSMISAQFNDQDESVRNLLCERIRRAMKT